MLNVYFYSMKKFSLIFFGLLILLNACQGVEKNTFKLNGTTNLPEGKQIFRIQANANNQPTTIDTATVANGQFSFKGSVEQIDVNFLFVEGEQVNTPFIVEEGTIEVNLLQERLTEMNLSGTSSNKDLQTYREETKTFADNLNSIASEIQSANSLGDNILVQDLQQQYTNLQADLFDYENNFIKSNVDSYISALILERFLNQKTLPRNEAKEIFSTYSDRIRSSKSGINVSNIVNAPVNPTAIGEIAPLFDGPSPNGDRIALENFRGKVVIIDFWASWCRPCRIENPNLVRLYKRMHDKGLEIVGVSLDRNKTSWERAIADDGLSWNHVSNLKYWADPIAQLYSVRAIPAAFVLDGEGRIVAKNLRGAQLDAKINDLLAD
jgi:peroxiredoxin